MPAKTTRKGQWVIRTFLVCDDVTQDKKDKWTIFGAYNGVVIFLVPQPPPSVLVMPKLTVFIGVQFSPGQYDFEVDVVDPKNKRIISGKMKFTGTDAEEVLHVPISWGPVRFHEAGTYTVRFGEARKKRRIGQFVVRMQPQAAQPAAS